MNHGSEGSSAYFYRFFRNYQFAKRRCSRSEHFFVCCKNVKENQSLLVLIAASFIPISFAFDGWYVATQISGEIKNSRKNLPKALIIGTVAVMVIYISYYMGIVFGMSGEEIIALKDTYITEFSRKIGSDLGALVMQVFIIISVLGTANGLLLATIRVPYQFANLEKSKKFFNLNQINSKTKMPLNSAFLGLAIIVVYLVIYYITNTFSFFTERNFDLSAIPIVFIYLVNTALFFGLFKLLKQNVFSGNHFFKSMMAVIAILGTFTVLFGTATSPNGISYFLVTAVFIFAGFVFKRKTDKNQYRLIFFISGISVLFANLFRIFQNKFGRIASVFYICTVILIHSK
ncbi:APC family permease [Kaistella anthropi]|nr:APC family permease [Kaistella anthropi]